MAGLYRTILVDMDQITVPANRRPVNADTVRTSAASIKRIGLQNPISVRAAVKNKYVLITGRHRLAAMRANGEHAILVSVMKVSDIDARLWEISENLHRAELTTLERSSQVAEWATLIETKREADKPREVREVSKGGRGNKGGIEAASRELGMAPTNVRQSIKIAAISDEAKDAAREAGLDDNQSALLKVAASPVDQQVEVVAEIVAAKAEKVSARPQAAAVEAPPHDMRAVAERLVKRHTSADLQLLVGYLSEILGAERLADSMAARLGENQGLDTFAALSKEDQLRATLHQMAFGPTPARRSEAAPPRNTLPIQETINAFRRKEGDDALVAHDSAATASAKPFMHVYEAGAIVKAGEAA